MLLFMFEEGYIRMEEYYCDGTTLQADASKHKVTKNTDKSRNKSFIKAIGSQKPRLTEPNRENVPRKHILSRGTLSDHKYPPNSECDFLVSPLQL
jgi:hypothetical protein